MRSPLTDKPLRNPGQSLDQKITDLAFNAIAYYLVAIICLFFAAFEWWKSLFNIPPQPMLVSGIALTVIIVAGIKIRSILKEIKPYKLGRDGEKAVGQYLELLREKGAKIHHDICAENFNVDHLVISTKGVFVVETKTWSKPDKGETKLECDGKTIFKFGQAVEPNPITQVVANASFIRGLIKQSTGRVFDIQPIVTFPGWYVESTSPSYLAPWVLNPKQIPGFIDNAKPRLSEEDVHLIAYHLSRYIRTTENA